MEGFKKKEEKMLRLFLVRHGQTEWNQGQRYQGHTDVPLDEIGRAQARLAGERLAREKLKVVYSSDLKRANETAQIIAQAAGCELKSTLLLRETSFGGWEGKTRREIESESPALFDSFLSNPIDNRPPGGETLIEVQSRILQVLAQIREEVREGSAAIVGHGGSLRWIVIDALGAPIDTFRRLHYDNGSISLIEYTQGSVWLSLFNDASHLNGLLSNSMVSIELNR
jgi:alpha-ribazole phosphatase